jgi:hypothetical protein
MTTAVQLRRGTTAEHATFTGLEGETTVDTTKTTLVVHNGSTAGGFAIAREDLANVSPTNLPVLTGADTASDDKFLIYDQSALTLKQITRAELNTAITQGTLSNVQIISGTINGTTIGGTTAAGGSFTTLNSSGATTLNGTTIPSSVTLVSTAATQTLTNKTLTSPTISGGTLNNISIGATTASTGAFTNLAYTGTLTGGTGVINIGSGQLYKDASGNVGIGTSSPQTVGGKLAVQSIGTITISAWNPTAVAANVGSTVYLQGGVDGNNLGYVGAFFTGSATTGGGYLTLGTRDVGGTTSEKMRITSAGNVGIGTSAPLSQCVVATSKNILSGIGDATNYTLSLRNPANANNEAIGLSFSSSTTATNVGASIYHIREGAESFGSLVFATKPSGGNVTERMRINSAGSLLVGTTGLTNNGILTVNGLARFFGTGDGSAFAIDKSTSTTTTSQVFAIFTVNNQNTGSGQINANGASQAAFGSFSDVRLKQNIVDLSPQLSNIMALRPVEFDYIESEGGGHQTGFVAQEIETVFSDAVGQRSDGMKTVTGWNKTEARLVKAIQEQQAIINDLKARLDAANL